MVLSEQHHAGESNKFERRNDYAKLCKNCNKV